MSTRLSIRHQLFLLIALAAAVLAALSAFAVISTRDSMMAERRLKTQAAVDLAYGLLDHYGKLAEAGSLPRADAQEAARHALGALRYEGGNYVFLLGLDYVMIKNPVRPETEGQSQASLKDANGVRMIVELVDAARRERGEFVEYLWPRAAGEAPQPKISTARLYAPWGWVVGTGIYVDDVQAAFRRDLLRLAVVAALAIGLLLAVSLAIARGITRPLYELRKAMLHIAETGDLKRRSGVEAGGELGEMAHAFDDMMARFGDIIREVGSGVETLSAATTQLVATAGAIERSTGSQSESASSVAAAVEEISTSVDQIADNVRQTAGLSNDLRRLSGSGRQVAQEAATEMRRIAEAVDTSSRAVRELGERSQRISDIVKVIGEIADQTNLLALNAAIEAARAGEQGRGFAVVADEVRKLAERTSHSTQEISAMTAAIREEIESTVSSIGRVSERAAQGLGLTLSADEAAARIDATAAEVATLIGDIAHATREQSSASQEIARNVESISRMAEDNAREVGQTAGLSRNLAGISERLASKVTQFSA